MICCGMVEIPSTYFITKFHQFGYNVTKTGDKYVSCCPFCREGKSWGKKKRLYYIPKENFLYCHNCSLSWHPYFWLKEIGGMTYHEIKEELKEIGCDEWYYEEVKTVKEEKRKTEPLPVDSINIFDPVQMNYYEDNNVIRELMKYVRKRRLDVATYRPKAYYVSLIDSYHKNRLIIPYYNSIGEVIYYQSRAIFEKELNLAKYMFKIGAENKEVFNLEKVDIDYGRIFCMEGSLDAMFVKNGISLGGINFTNYQKSCVDKEYPFHETVYVLDNPYFDKTADEKIEKLLEEEKSSLFFTWGGSFSEYKDFSEMAEKLKINEISVDEINQFVFPAKKAKILFDKIRLNRN